MKIKAELKNLIYPFAAVLLFIAVWAAAARAVGIELLLPSPSSALKGFWGLLSSGDFYTAALSTLSRSLISFALAFVFATLAAVAAGLANPVHRLFSPIILILRSTPTISIILLSLVWLNSRTAPMLIAFLIIFPSMYASIYTAIKGVSPELREMSEIYRVSRMDRITKLYIPSAAPVIFDSAKSNISLNLKIIIASEVLAQTNMSMGKWMHISKIQLDTPQLLAWTIAAVLLSYFLELAVALLKGAAIRWKI